MKALFEILSVWSALKKTESNRIVRSMYLWLILVPIIAKLMSKFNGPLNLTFSGNIYQFDISLPFTWGIFFFSALSFTFANIVFIIFAPSIIKDNDDYSDFESAGKDKRHLEKYYSLKMKRDWARHSSSLMSKHSGLYPDIKERFWKAFDERDASHERARYSCLFFYSFGFALFFVVALENLWWVLSEVFF